MTHTERPNSAPANKDQGTQLARTSLPATQRHDWWQDAVIYQIYPRSFADSDGDGVGDLPGITSRLPHIASLGASAVWLSPFYRSPQRDAGYDVADYRDVDPLFGTLADAEAMIERAHELGLRVIVDLVPNHTSDEHAWFRAALKAGPGSPERGRYWFRDGKVDPKTGEVDPTKPPTNWVSVFGGPAWTRVADREDAPGSPWENDGQWYLNMFDSSQPDLNWELAEVHEEFRSILRFWLDRGVDGFRVDVAHGLVKDPALPDWGGETQMVSGSEPEAGASAGEASSNDEHAPSLGDVDPTARAGAPMFDQPRVHEIYREWRAVLEEYDHNPILVAEAWVDTPERLIRYIRPDEMHQAFNFNYLVTPWETERQRLDITDSLETHERAGVPSTWVLSNHDVVRHATRMGLPVTGKGPNGIRPGEPQPDAELGLRRAKAATLLMLALPGSSYLYQGEELGLPDHISLPDGARQDPAFFRLNGAEAGRDGCRVPIPWKADAPAFGFGPSEKTWLPQPPEYRDFAVDVMEADPDSTLPLYRRAIALRTQYGLGRGHWRWVGDSGLVATNEAANSGDGESMQRPEVLIVTAIEQPVVAPQGWRVVLASHTAKNLYGGGATIIPADTTAWLIRD